MKLLYLHVNYSIIKSSAMLQLTHKFIVICNSTNPLPHQMIPSRKYRPPYIITLQIIILTFSSILFLFRRHFIGIT